MHHFLCRKSNLYHLWHHNPFHRKIHFSLLGLYTWTVALLIIVNVLPLGAIRTLAASNSWNFTGDNTQYDYDSSKISTSDGNASLTNPGSTTGSSTSINAKAGTKTNTSASFASANKEYLTIPSNSSLQTGDIDFEIGGWVRFDTVTGIQYLVSKYSEYAIYMSSGTVSFRAGVGGPTVTVAASTFGAVSANVWYKIRAWVTKADKTAHISINDIENTGTYTGTQTTGTDPLVFGSPYTTGVSPYYLNGRLDSWYFTKRISTTAEATSLYNAGAGRTYNDLTAANGLDTFKSGLTSWWDFNEEGGTRYDSKGTNHLTSAADAIIAPPVYGSELIVNGGFETVAGNNFGTWEETAGTGAIEDEITIVHSGSHSAKLTQGTTTYILQQIAVVAGASYYYSFWSYGDGTNAGRYSIYDTSNGAFIQTVASTNNKTAEWKLLTGQFTATTGCAAVRLIFYPTNVDGAIAYFDDVSVKRITTASINNGGFDDRPATGGEKTNVSTVSRSRTSNVATMVATAHGLKNNDVVTITGMTDTTFNGTNKTVTVVDVDTFTYASTGSDAGSAADTGGRIATDVFSSWNEVASSTSTVNAETIAPYSGSYAARLDVNAGGSFTGVNQTIISGKSYSLTAYAKSDSLTNSPNIGVEFGSCTVTKTIPLTTSYAAYTVSAQASGTAFYLRGNGNSRSVFIDQVTLTSLGPTAEAGIAAGNAIDGNFGAGFNGTNQYLSVADNASVSIGDEDATIFGSFYLDKIGVNNPIVVKQANSTNREFRIHAASSNLVQFVVFSGGTGGGTAVFSAIPVTTSNWFTFIAWHDSVANKIWISVNNETPVSADFSGGLFNGVSPLTMGYNQELSQYLAGRADGVGLIKRVLTSDERTALYNNGKGLKYASLPDSIKNDSALKAYWNLDEKSGTRYDSTSNHNDLTDNGTVTQVQGVNYYEGTVGTVFDASGNNNTFTQSTLSKRPTYSSLGIGNKPSMLFDGVDDSLMATGDKIGTGDVTVTAVINAKSFGGSGASRIMENGKFLLSINTTGAKATLSSDGGWTNIVSADNSIALNTSYVITVTRTSAGIVNFYINGALSGTANQNSGTPETGSDTYIGNRAAGDRAFDGSIGTVQIYNKILDPIQRNNIEQTLGATYGITVASQSGTNASSSIYPTISTKSPLKYSALTSFSNTMSVSNTGTVRYQLSNDSTDSSISSSTWYYYNGSNWVTADKNNAYQSNTKDEVNTNLQSFSSTITPNHNLKWRTFFITDGVDNPSLTSVDMVYVSDTEAPNNPDTNSVVAKDSLNGSNTLTTDHWYNYATPSFTFAKPQDNAKDFEISSGIAGYLTYFGTDNTANIGLSNGLVTVGANNGAFSWQNTGTAETTGTETYTVPSSPALTSGQTYYFKVVAVDNAGNAHYLTDSSSYNLFTYKYDTEAPTNVNYVTVSPQGCSTASEFTMSWNKVAGGNDGIAKYQYNLGKQKDTNGNLIIEDVAVTDPDQTTYSTTVKPYTDGDNIFYVRPVDNAGNALDNWQSGVFCKTGFVGVVDGPTITSGPSSIDVSWTSSKKTTSYVKVYDGNTYVSEQGQTTFALTHKVRVVGLEPEKSYRYRLSWTDESGNIGESDWYDVKTANTPQITNLNAEIISPSKVLVTWQTNYVSVSKVEYGIDQYDKSLTVDGKASSFSSSLDSLTPGKNYQLRIRATSEDGASFTAGVTFSTPPLPFVSSLTYEPDFTAAQASYKFTWNTNTATSSALYYKLKDDTTYKSASSPDLVTYHELVVPSFSDQSSYIFYAGGMDQYGNIAKSDTQTFDTPFDSRPPKLNDLTTEIKSTGLGSSTKASIIVTWNTDEPATSQVEYSLGIQGTEYSFKTKEDSSLSTSHAVVISELEPSKIYHLRAISHDKAGNQGLSDDTTTITGKSQQSVLDIIITSLQKTLGWMFNVFK